MALNPPTPGLRTLHWFGKTPFKGNVVAELGDEMTVPDGIADQLSAQSTQWKDGPAPDPQPEVEAEPEDEAPAADGTLTKAELLDLAGEYDIPGRSSMTKAELTEAIQAAAEADSDD